MASEWKSQSWVSGGDTDKSDKDLVSGGQCVMAGGHFVSPTVSAGMYWWKDRVGRTDVSKKIKLKQLLYEINMDDIPDVQVYVASNCPLQLSSSNHIVRTARDLHPDVVQHCNNVH